MYRAGFVALLGEPNAGKSTLLNAILGEKVSIVSDRPQTTRNRVHGIYSDKNGQIVFVDAPGVLKSTSGVNGFLQEEIESVLSTTDAILVVIEPDTSALALTSLLERARASKKPFFTIVTKGDLIKGLSVPVALEQLVKEKVQFVVLSPLKKIQETRDEVVPKLLELLPESEKPLFDEDLLTTEPMRKIAAEYVRESCFKNLKAEVPYGLAVRVTKYQEAGSVTKAEAMGRTDVTRIYCDIIVDRDGHKGIVIGAKGSMLKKIGSEARKSIETLVGGPVYLELHVDVREGWTSNKRLMKELGYVITDKK